MCKYGLFWPMPVCLSMVCSDLSVYVWFVLAHVCVSMVYYGLELWGYYGVVLWPGVIMVWFVLVSACTCKCGLFWSLPVCLSMVCVCMFKYGLFWSLPVCLSMICSGLFMWLLCP